MAELGEEIGQYRIEAVAGQGAMGVVYRASQERPRRQVALKLVAPQLSADPQYRARFEREAQVAASLDHPNVIPVYEVGEHRGQLFIAMRYVQGTDLRGALSRGPLAPHDAVRVVAQVASALDAAHRQGLVHRDVKPANVLLAEDGHVYLTDFGIARPQAGGEAMTQVGSFVGTVEYAAPEQLRGEHVDARTDVWALAAVLFTALTGHAPFAHARTPVEHHEQRERGAPRVDQVVPGIPSRLADVVAAGLAFDPGRRPGSCGELAHWAGQAVVAPIAAEPPHRPPPPPPLPPTRGFDDAATRVGQDVPAGGHQQYAPAAFGTQQGPPRPPQGPPAGQWHAPPQPWGQGGPPPPPRKRSRGPLLATVGGAVALIVLVLVLVLTSGGGGGDGPKTVANTTSTPTTSTTGSGSTGTGAGDDATSIRSDDGLGPIDIGTRRSLVEADHGEGRKNDDDEYFVYDVDGAQIELLFSDEDFATDDLPSDPVVKAIYTTDAKFKLRLGQQLVDVTSGLKAVKDAAQSADVSSNDITCPTLEQIELLGKLADDPDGETDTVFTFGKNGSASVLLYAHASGNHQDIECPKDP